MKKITLLVFISILILAGCSPARATSSNAEIPAMEPAAAAPEMDKSYSMDGGEFESPMAEEAAGRGGDAVSVERVVIMNADLNIVVPDPAAAMSEITDMANEMGGFVVTSNLYKTTTDNGVEVPEANITVRVPAEQLNEAMDQIKALVDDPDVDIRTENVNGQDVTREYTDLQSRLRNLEQSEERLQAILDEAKRTEDVLNVYNQLTYVTEQIEVLKGQIQYYDEAARLSAISVRLQSKESVQPLVIAGWQPAGVARDAIQTLIRTMQGVGSLAIWGVLFCLPTGIIVLIPAYFIYRAVRAVLARRKAAKLTPPPAAAD